MNPIFSRPLVIIDTLLKHKHQAFFVGGSVRDLLLGREIGDVDITTSAKPEEVISLFSKTIPVGLTHGTVIVMIDNVGYEVTTFRKDEKYLDFRRPTNVTFIDSLLEDLKRRDFTMNAIAMDRNGILYDPFNGQDAINKKKIQTVGDPFERFKEDALRMIRAIRFHSQLSFKIGEETMLAIRQDALLLKHVSIERVTTEIEKILAGPSCKSAMKLLVETGLTKSIEALVPYNSSLVDFPFLTYNAARNRTETWALFCFLLKVKDTEQFLKSWKLPVKIMKDAKKIVEGLELLQENTWTSSLMYQLGLELTQSTERIYSLLLHLPVQQRLITRTKEYGNLPIHSRKDMAINGHDLFQLFDKKPGPWVNEALTEIERAILTNQIKNDRESIKEWLVSCNRF